MTTSTTHVILLQDGTRYTPDIRRLISNTNFATGTTSYAILDTAKYRVARASLRFTSKAAGSTFTLYAVTGRSTAALARSVLTSSGAASITKATSGGDWHVFRSLDRYTGFFLNEAGGAAASTGIFLDVELA